MTRAKHLAGLIGTVALAVLTIWAGPTVAPETTVAAKIAQSIVVALGLLCDPTQLVKVRHAFLAVATITAAVISTLAIEAPAGSAMASLMPIVLAVMTNLRIALQTAAPAVPPAVVLLSFLWAASAQARCLWFEKDGTTCKLGEHFAAIVPAVAIDMKTGQAAAGVEAASLGICHGFAWRPDQWHSSGIDLCASAQLSQRVPNTFGASMLVFVADYGSIGVGALGTQTPDGVVWHGMLYLAPRLPIP